MAASVARTMLAVSLLSVTGAWAGDGPFSGTAMVSVDQDGMPDLRARALALNVMSEDGRFVAFQSDNPNLVPGDTNGDRDLELENPGGGGPVRGLDVFVRDRARCVTERVSVSSAGEEAQGDSFRASITPDGRYVAFASWAPNLVAGERTEHGNAFIRDRVAATTERVSVAPDGSDLCFRVGQASMSADGRLVLFGCSTIEPLQDEFVFQPLLHDRTTGETRLLRVIPSGELADGGVGALTLSADGTTAVFSSSAWNLVPPDVTAPPFVNHVYAHDIASETTTLLNRTESGEIVLETSGVDVSADGCVVTFGRSTALGGGVMVHDCRIGFAEPISARGSFPTISADGRRVALQAPAEPFDEGSAVGAFVYDRETGGVELVCTACAGPVFISPDGNVALPAGTRPLSLFGPPGTVPTVCEIASVPRAHVAALATRAAPAECAGVDLPRPVLARLDRALARAHKAVQRASERPARGERALRRVQAALRGARRRSVRWAAATPEEATCQPALVHELDECLAGIAAARTALAGK